MTGVQEWCAAKRLQRAAAEFVGPDLAITGTEAEVVERFFIQALIDAIARRAHRCDHGTEIVRILLKRMPADHAEVEHLITLIDDEDGWPSCRVLNAIKGLCCALEFRSASSRWLPEAAIQIGELYTGRAADGFSGSAKAWAGSLLAVTIAQVRA